MGLNWKEIKTIEKTSNTLTNIFDVLSDDEEEQKEPPKIIKVLKKKEDRGWADTDTDDSNSDSD